MPAGKPLPPGNLPSGSTEFYLDLQQRLLDIEQALTRGAQENLNTNKSQNATIDVLGQNIVDLEANVAALVASLATTLNIDMSQVTTGNLDGSRLSGTVGIPVNTSTVTAELHGNNITFDIVTTRVALWGRTSDGLVATASSTETLKTNIRPADWDDAKLEAIMGMSLRYYNWLANVQYIEYNADLPDDHPDKVGFVSNPLEIGFIAEEMHEAGLWEFVVYERNPDDSLMLNTETNEPIPHGIHYHNWSLALHAVAQRLWADRKRDRADLDMVMAHLGLTANTDKEA